MACKQLGSCLFPLNCSRGYSTTKSFGIVTFIQIQKKTSVQFTDCNGEFVDKIIAQGTVRKSVTSSLSVSYICSCPGGRTSCIQNPDSCNDWNNKLAAHRKKVDDALAENSFLECVEDTGGYCPPVTNCGVVVRPGRWITRVTCKESIASEDNEICIGSGCSC